MPDRASRYRLPWTSQYQAPSARAMTSGCFDHSAIWSRTKIWRRNRSSVAWASAMRSGRSAGAIVVIGGSHLGAVEDRRQGVQVGDAAQVVDRDPLLERVLPAGPRAVR